MSAFSIKKIKLFANRIPAPKRNKNNPNPINSGGDEQNIWRKIFRNPFFYLIIIISLIAYLISYLPSKSLPNLNVGEIASADIIAPTDLVIEDEESTQKRRDEAAEAVLPYYYHNPNVFLDTEEKIREFFSLGRTLLTAPPTPAQIDAFNTEISEKFGFTIPGTDIRTLEKLQFPESMEENLISLIGKVSAGGIILTKELFIHNEQEKGLTLLMGDDVEKILQISEIPDINESKVRLSQEISNLEISSNEKALLTLLSHHFVAANITYSPISTNSRREAARNSIETVFYTIKKGKVIVRRGDEITADNIKLIAAINENLSLKPSWLTNFTGALLLFAVLFLALLFYQRSRYDADIVLRRFIMTGITLLLSLVFYKLSIALADIFSQNTTISLLEHSESYRFAFPLQMGPLLFAFLLGIHPALIFTVINSIMVGYLFKSNFYLLIFTLIGGLTAIFGVKHFGKHTRTTILRAGFFLIAPINIITIITFHLIRENVGPLEILSSELFMGLVGGLLSSALAFLILPLYENFSGIITQTRLLELANSDLPIFRKMAMEAPGSYHHSLIVASLAEKAAEEIGLDPLLVKAGSLYHDIGKIKRPEYFIENLTRNFDMHKHLKPSMSSLVIINHVKEGLEQAQKLKLPKKIKDIIAQHHGDSLVKYFFEKAKEEYNPKMLTVGEESYRYAGPKPKSKEAALVMLADSVEAASRSIKKPSKANFKRAINEILNNYMQDCQLDDSNLTLKELKTAANSFLNTLYTIYHPRVEYPGFDFEGKKKKNNNAKTINDRNNKSAI